MYDFLARLLKDRQEAADVTQDTFIRAMQTLPNLEKPESFRSWLFTIAHRNGLNLIQRSKRSVPTPAMEEPGRSNPLMRIVDEDRMSSPERVVEAREVAEVVWEAAAGLDTRTYTVLDLHVRQGLKSAEIADVMGVSKGNAYTMVNRMKSSIRDSLGIYILARRGTKDCAKLESLLSPYYLPPVTPEIRRMVERHAKTCDTCDENRKAFVLPLATFAAFALVPPPAGTKAAIWAALGGGAALTGSGQSSGGAGAGAAATGAAAASAAVIAVAATNAPGVGGTALAGATTGAAGAAASAASGAAFGMGKVAAALAIVVAIGAGAIGAVSLLSGDQPAPDVAVLSSTVVDGNGGTATPEDVPVATPGSTVAPDTTTTTSTSTTNPPTTTTTTPAAGGTTATTAAPTATPTPTTSTTAAPVTTTTAPPVTTTTSPPIAEVTAGDDSVSTLEDVPVDVAVLANDDASLDAATLSVVGAPSHGTLTINGGIVTYVPEKDFFGADSFRYSARNAAGASAIGTVSVAVAGVNDPPRVLDPVVVVVDEDSSVSFDPMTTVFDVEGDAVTMVFFDPTSAAGGTVTEGSLVYTPPPNFNGIDQFTYGMSDGIDTTRVVVSVTVNSVNDAPTGTAPSVSTMVDTPLLIDVLGAYQDVDGDALSFVFINPFETAAGGTFSLSGDQLLYVPPLGYVGEDQLDYMITDGEALVSDSVSISVLDDGGENSPPIVEDQTIEVSEDEKVGSVVGTIAAKDLEGDVLTYALTGDGPFAVDGSSGEVSLTAELNFEEVSSYSLAVTVTDSAGGLGEAVLDVVVLDANEAPSIDDLQFVIAATFKAGDTVGTLNASDPDAGDKLTYSVSGTDQFATTDDGFLVVGEKFVPVEGLHELIVTVTDAGGLSADAKVTVVVESVTTVIGEVSFSPSVVYIVDGVACDLGPTKLTVVVNVVDPDFDARTITMTWLNRLDRPTTQKLQQSEDGTWTTVVQFGKSFVRDGEPAELFVRAVSNSHEVAATEVFSVELLDCVAGEVIPAGSSLQEAINLGRKGSVSRRKRIL
ncbi:MAG: sigma-70 family RNA polymerase sigma factor [Acidimicrobiia bacterium]|nr:sigma-70 family RNA polymerase sigma factor [Acidimicrobiia bacterium]